MAAGRRRAVKSARMYHGRRRGVRIGNRAARRWRNMASTRSSSRKRMRLWPSRAAAA